MSPSRIILQLLRFQEGPRPFNQADIPLIDEADEDEYCEDLPDVGGHHTGRSDHSDRPNSDQTSEDLGISDQSSNEQAVSDQTSLIKWIRR